MRHRRAAVRLDGGLNKVDVAWLIASRAAVMPFPGRSDLEASDDRRVRFDKRDARNKLCTDGVIDARLAAW
jgi:hypothetical protein